MIEQNTREKKVMKNDEIVMKIRIMPRTIFVAVPLLEINSKRLVITLP